MYLYLSKNFAAQYSICIGKVNIFMAQWGRNSLRVYVLKSALLADS